MEQTFKELLMLFRFAVQGESELSGITCDVRALMEQAKAQQIGAVIFPAVQALYQSGQTDLSEEEFFAYEQAYTQVIMKQVQRQYALAQTVKKLEEGGVPCCLLKGASLAELYPIPEARISGDADLYIGAENEQSACRILMENDFTILERPVTSHHAMCKSQATGLIELHLTLYDDMFEDVWFNNRTAFCEPWETMTTAEGYTYHVLGVTDRAIFNTLHLTKHFLSEGVGIRQMMDVLLYLRRYADKMDVKRYTELLKELHYDAFMRACLRIGVLYLGFDEADFSSFAAELGRGQIAPETLEAVLYDVAGGGVFGQESDTRKQFYLRYTEARYRRFKAGSYAAYIGRWNLRRVFPPRAYMKTQYEPLQKHPSLLPLFYVKRIAERMTKPGRMQQIKPSGNAQAELEKRMQLVRELRMI